MLSEFLAHQPTLEKLAAQAEHTLRQALKERGLVVQFVSSRVKSPDSLKQKLARPDKTYRHLWDVTDLVGVRIATYFEDTVDEVARLIEQLGHVDFTHSTDKQRFTDPGRFGYRSLHYVCALPGNGLDPSFRYEVQVRTALQHAWAEVEHDLGYKADSVPLELRRRFSRVASLLEIADQEFVSLRRELDAYRHAIDEEVRDLERRVPLDVLSLGAVTRTPLSTQLDAAVSRILNKPLEDTPFFPEYLVRLLSLARVDTTAALQAAMARAAPEFDSFVRRYFEFSRTALDFPAERVEAVQRGYSLLFVGFFSIVRDESLTLSKVARLTQVFSLLDGLDERSAQSTAGALVAALGGD